MSAQLRQLAGRATWNIADQVVSSATNLLLSILVARALTADGFGAFAIAFTLYSFLVGASRALISQPLVVRYTSHGPDAFRSAARSATGAATVLGIASGAATVGAGLLIGGAVGVSLLAIGVLMPGLLLQDMWRAVFIAEGRPSAAFVNDVIWGVVQIAAVSILIRLERESAAAMIVGWGGAALIAALLGGKQFRGHPQLRASWAWIKGQRDLLGYYAARFLSILGAYQVTLLLIAALGDPSDVGALRAVQVVLGPLNLVGYSVVAFASPEIARRQLSGRAALKVAAAISGVMVLVDVIWGAALLLLPDRVGIALLGDSWSNAQGVLPATLLGVVVIGMGLGPSTLLMARGFARDSFWASALLAPAFLILGVLGLHLDGAAGAALGLSAAQLLVTPVLWWRAIVLMRREPSPGKPAVGDVAQGGATAPRGTSGSSPG